MNKSNTPKIVVGIGLAAVYATALAAFIPRGAHDKVVAQNASGALTAQIAPESAPPVAIVPASADASTSVAAPLAATTAAAAPIGRTTAKALDTPSPRRESEARSQGNEQPATTVATVSPAKESEVGEPRPVSEGNGVDHDSLSTVEVPPQMAAVAPNGGTVDITPKDGVPEPTGSVSSEEK